MNSSRPREAEWFGSETASTATLAVEWLVARTGVDALVAYYRTLPVGDGWERTFERTFGLSPQAAYEDFAAFRAQALGERRSISGSVVGPDGAPITTPDQTMVFVSADHTDGSSSEGTTVQANGEFNLRPRDGIYILYVSFVCPGSQGDLGWYREPGGHTTARGQATVVTVDGASISGIDIRLPAPFEERARACFVEDGS